MQGQALPPLPDNPPLGDGSRGRDRARAGSESCGTSNGRLWHPPRAPEHVVKTKLRSDPSPTCTRPQVRAIPRVDRALESSGREEPGSACRGATPGTRQRRTFGAEAWEPGAAPSRAGSHSSPARVRAGPRAAWAGRASPGEKKARSWLPAAPTPSPCLDSGRART